MTAISSTTSPAGSWNWSAAAAIRSRATIRLAGTETEAPEAGGERGKRPPARSGREQEWIQASPRARQTKNRARIQRYEELLAEIAEQAGGVADIVIPPGPRLGNMVIEAEGVRKAYGDKLLIENLNFKLPPGGIVGVIGPNGAGKTTLFRMITGQEKPDAGTLRVGETVKLGMSTSRATALNPDKTVWQEISDGKEVIELGKRAIQSRAYVAAFNFKGSDQQKKVGILSGGERNRVHLAKMLKPEHNVILLDEPTNDLDVETLRALEEALTEFAGCAVIISQTAGSSTGWPPICWRSRATATSNGSKAISRPMKRTSAAAWGPTRRTAPDQYRPLAR